MERPLDPKATNGSEHGAVPDGEHPALERLAAYRGDRLPTAEQEALQDHLASCPECADTAMALAYLADESPETDLDLEAYPSDEAAWQDLRVRLGQVERGPADAPREPLAIRTKQPSATGAMSARIPWTLAAMLAIAVLGLGSWVATLQREIALSRQPRLGLPIVDLLPEGWARSGEEMVRVAADGRFVLILNPPEPAPDADHDIEIVDAAGERLWRGSGLRPSPAGNFFVELSRQLVPAGTITLRVLREERVVATFDLRVEDD